MKKSQSVLVRIGISVVYATCFSVALMADSRHHHAHEHGRVNIAIAVESNQLASLELIAPSESIYGFEHRPRTDEQRMAKDAGLNLLKHNMGQAMVFGRPGQCEVKFRSVEVKYDDEHDDDHSHSHSHDHEGHSGTHSEVHAFYEVHCNRDMKGMRIRLNLKQFFNAIHHADITVLTENAQDSHSLRNGNGTFRLP